MNRELLGIGLAAALAVGTGCKPNGAEQKSPSTADRTSHGDHEHKGDGHDHAEHGESEGDGHAAEVDLGTVTIGDMKVACAQGYGTVEPGKESHLVVKLPYNDQAATVARAWVGTSDRTLSFGGKGEYAASHDDFDVHAIAPDPLPANVMWWIEVEKPDGTRVVGSVKPLLD